MDLRPAQRRPRHAEQRHLRRRGELGVLAILERHAELLRLQLVRPGTYTEVSEEAPDHATYLNNLIAYLKTQYNVDEDRVYVYGYSNGGYMCHRLACENGNYGFYGYPDTDADPSGDIIPPQPIAAVATYAGVTFMNPENCNGVWPTNVLHTHDMGDQSCLYAGGLDTGFSGVCYPGLPRPYPGAIATVSSWIFMNQTTGEGEMLEPIVPFDLAVPYSMAQVLDWPMGDTDPPSSTGEGSSVRTAPRSRTTIATVWSNGSSKTHDLTMRSRRVSRSAPAT